MIKRLAMMGVAVGIGVVSLAAQTPAPATAKPLRYPVPENIQTVHVALLYRVPTYTPGPAADAQQLMEGHLAHLTKLGNQGHAFIAGPISGGGDLAGLVFLKAPTADAAKALEAEDPAVKAGRFRIEMVSYMSPANWFAFGPIKDDLKMRTFVFGFLKMKPGAKPLDATATDDHLATLWSLRQSGTLVAAGPAVNAGDRAGAFVLAVDTIEKAKAIFDNEPGVKSGTYILEMYRWSAADGIMKGK